MTSIRIRICCDGVKPEVKRIGAKLVRYQVVCPRCFEPGPVRFSMERAETAWNRRIRGYDREDR